MARLWLFSGAGNLPPRPNQEKWNCFYGFEFSLLIPHFFSVLQVRSIKAESSEQISTRPGRTAIHWGGRFPRNPHNLCVCVCFNNVFYIKRHKHAQSERYTHTRETVDEREREFVSVKRWKLRKEKRKQKRKSALCIRLISQFSTQKNNNMKKCAFSSTSVKTTKFMFLYTFYTHMYICIFSFYRRVMAPGEWTVDTLPRMFNWMLSMVNLNLNFLSFKWHFLLTRLIVLIKGRDQVIVEIVQCT